MTVDTAIVLTGNPSRYTSQLTLNNYFAILTQFGFQEPGTNEEIKAFAASKNFTGLLMDKINVNGSKTSPVFAYLVLNNCFWPLSYECTSRYLVAPPNGICAYKVCNIIYIAPIIKFVSCLLCYAGSQRWYCGGSLWPTHRSTGVDFSDRRAAQTVTTICDCDRWPSKIHFGGD